MTGAAWTRRRRSSGGLRAEGRRCQRRGLRLESCRPHPLGPETGEYDGRLGRAILGCGSVSVMDSIFLQRVGSPRFSGRFTYSPCQPWGMITPIFTPTSPLVSPPKQVMPEGQHRPVPYPSTPSQCRAQGVRLCAKERLPRRPRHDHQALRVEHVPTDRRRTLRRHVERARRAATPTELVLRR